MAADKFDAPTYGVHVVSLLFRSLNHDGKADVIWRNSINECSCRAYEWIGQDFCWNFREAQRTGKLKESGMCMGKRISSDRMIPMVWSQNGWWMELQLFQWRSLHRAHWKDSRSQWRRKSWCGLAKCNGTVAVWLMNGTVIDFVGFPGSVAWEWELQP